MQRNGMTREELLQTLRRRDLALYAGGVGLVVTAQSGQASRLVRSKRFQQALERERYFVGLYVRDDDSAVCADPADHQLHYRAAVDDLGADYSYCPVCACWRMVAGTRLEAASTPIHSMAAYRRRKIGRAV